MPDPEKLLTALRRAADLSRAVPGRRGRVIEIARATDILVAGDLHGNIANFQRLLKLADLATHPQRHFVMQELIHGKFHYVDGADKSHQAVDLWAALKCQFPDRVHYLPGNHELSQWTNRAIGKGDLDLNESFLNGVRVAYRGNGDAIYAAYLDLFRALPLAIRTTNRIFLSHSLPNATSIATFNAARLLEPDHTEDELKPGGLVYSLVWGRDVSAANASEFLRRVDADWLVTGHVPCEDGFARPNERQLIVDCLGSPAACVLLPADRELTTESFGAGVMML